MEIFIIIPIVAVIYGWMQSFPVIPAPAESINGVAFGNGFCDDYAPNDESLIISQDDDTFSTDTSFDNDMNLGTGIDTPDMVHELMFNPAFEWNSLNIYHHDDIGHDIGVNDAFSDPFCNSFDDMTSIHNFD